MDSFADGETPAQGCIIHTYLFPDDPNFDFPTFYDRLAELVLVGARDLHGGDDEGDRRHLPGLAPERLLRRAARGEVDPTDDAVRTRRLEMWL